MSQKRMLKSKRTELTFSPDPGVDLVLLVPDVQDVLYPEALSLSLHGLEAGQVGSKVARVVGHCWNHHML